MSPKKILHVIASVDPATGGIIEGVLQQQNAMKATGQAECEVVSLDRPGAPYLRDFPIKVHAQGEYADGKSTWASPLAHYGYTAKLIPWLRTYAHEYDAVIVDGLWNYASLAASVVLRNRKVPYFVFTHGMLDPWFRRQSRLKHLGKQMSWLLFEGPLLANAEMVLFTTEAERKSARGQFWGASYKEHVIGFGTGAPPPASPAQELAFRKMLPALGSRPFLLFLSRIHPKKGCDLLIDAFSKVAGRFPDLDLVIAGPDQVGIQGELLAQAAALGLGQRIHWPGMLSGDAKWGAYRAAKAFILPSHQENFGVVVAEALACDTPVLISNKINIADKVELSGGGLVEEDNLSGTTNLMLRFLSLSEEVQQIMRHQAGLCFETNFEVTGFSQRLVQLVLAARSPK
ncbi:MAG: glycosyltransferase [Formivibrio sp.]|nr:glycosyltransferase [Formivibrio sp.]